MAMTKKEHIKYWVGAAEMDWNRAERCFKDKDYVFCLFCLHLSLEKIIKATWVEYNEKNIPPKIHNLVALIKMTPLEIQEKDMFFLGYMNKFQLEGRYPDYAGKIYKECTREYTKGMMRKAKQLKVWFLKDLQKI
jgi:HEPN domain-containing protein